MEISVIITFAYYSQNNGMKKFFLFFLLLWAFIIQILAQLPNDFRTEQIFLCPKKTEWTSSDTIELEGQVTCLAGNRVLPYSK